MKKLYKCLLFSFSALFLCFVGVAVWYFAITKEVKLDKNKLILQSDNVEIFDIYGEKAQSVSAYFPNAAFKIDNLPSHVKYAFIDTEDKRFYSHDGFDYKRIVKAALENVKAGSFKEGASTISQQLVKNTHLSQKKTIKRKVQEYKLTRKLEREFTKDEILEKYLNSIYFGHNCFGLEAAAQFYFSKSPENLTIADGAILAGLVKSPNNYSPFKRPENCKKRKSVVLSCMLREKHITKEEKRLAEAEPIPSESPIGTADKSYFFRVYDELESLAEEKNLRLGGQIRIDTYFDPSLQRKLSERATNLTTDAVFAVLDNQTSGVKGYYSTVGAPKRMTGSLLKPLLVYAPALEEGIISPATPILDERTDFGGYSPKNYGDRYFGYVSAREALAQSLNVPAVKILSATGVKKAASYLAKTGLTVSDDDLSLALALGGMKEGFSLLELSSAYSTFARQGLYDSPSFIRSINVNGQVIYEKESKNRRVFSEETSYLLTDMLKTAARSGTAKKLRSLPFSVAAKTGTHGNQNGNTDAYCLSYTTSDTVGVWLGNADNTPTDITGGGACADVVYEIQEFLGQRHIPNEFEKPSGVVSASLDIIEYSTTHNIVLADENAPVHYRFSELFDEKRLPKIQSKKFSNPFISAPSVRFDDGVVRIDLSALPDFYDYEIERIDYDRHTTVYKGAWEQEFVDDTLQSGKIYEYTVTPYFSSRRGNTILLPAVTTKEQETVIPEEPPEITQKDWWNQ